MTITVYHNPRCSKSRQALALITDRGHDPDIVEYLKQPPSVAELKRIIALLDITAHDLMRTGESEYRELGLGREDSEESLLEAMASHPRLIERPIVIVGQQARIGRPPESVLEILP